MVAFFSWNTLVCTYLFPFTNCFKKYFVGCYYYYYFGSYLFCRLKICHPLLALRGAVERSHVILIFCFLSFFFFLLKANWCFPLTTLKCFFTLYFWHLVYSIVMEESFFDHIYLVFKCHLCLIFSSCSLLNFLVYFHWINSLHYWYLSHLLILPPGFLDS